MAQPRLDAITRRRPRAPKRVRIVTRPARLVRTRRAPTRTVAREMQRRLLDRRRTRTRTRRPTRARRGLTETRTRGRFEAAAGEQGVVAGTLYVAPVVTV